MWDYGGSRDDADHELPLEVLQDNVEDMLDNTKKCTNLFWNWVKLKNHSIK